MKKILLAVLAGMMLISFVAAHAAEEVPNVPASMLIPVGMTNQIQNLITTKIAENVKRQKVNAVLSQLASSRDENSFCGVVGKANGPDVKNVEELTQMCVARLQDANGILRDLPDANVTSDEFQKTLSAIVLFAVSVQF